MHVFIQTKLMAMPKWILFHPAWKDLPFYNVYSGNTKGGSITVLLTSCLTGLESAV
jgi:hypothetical protein